MSLYKNIYFAALAGALAGILTWGASGLLLIALDVKRGLWIPDATVVFLLGFLLATFVFRYMDYAAGRPMRWVILGWGALYGLGSAVIAVLVIWLLQTHIQMESPILFRLVVWTLAGSLIGMGIGLRWVKSNRVRVLHTYAGGLAGGLLAA